MSEVLLDWNDLVGKHEWPTLLLGNGFSINIWPGFSYANIHANANLTSEELAEFDENAPTDFERALGLLTDKVDYACTFGHDPTNLCKRRDSIRKKFFETFHAIHPSNDAVKLDVLTQLQSELLMYRSVFTLNYDLIIESALFGPPIVGASDGFPGPSNTYDPDILASASTRIRYLHGALHLWHEPTPPRDYKCLSPALSDNVTQNGTVLPCLQLAIAGGYSAEKWATLPDSDYLTDSFDALEHDSGNTVVLGAKLHTNDDHIIDKLNTGRPRHFAVSVYPHDQNESANATRARIRAAFSECHEVAFFDSTTHPLTSSSLNCDSADG